MNSTYELQDHLGNACLPKPWRRQVRVTLSDRKLSTLSAGIPTNFTADVKGYYNKYPYHAQQPGRNFNPGDYRFNGPQGSEDDKEIKGQGNHYAYDERGYDPWRAGWDKIDPFAKDYVPISPYVFALGNPIYFVDEEGNVVIDKNGNEVVVSLTMAKNGTATASYQFAANTSQATIDEFMANGATILDAMLKVPGLVEDVNDFVNIPTEIKFTLTQQKLDNGQAHGLTDPETNVKNGVEEPVWIYKNGKKYYKKVEIKISTAKLGDKDRYYTASDEETMVSVTAHECPHLQPEQIDKDYSSMSMKKKESTPVNAEYRARRLYLNKHAQPNTFYSLAFDKNFKKYLGKKKFKQLRDRVQKELGFKPGVEIKNIK